jgi:hypothetical protein
MKSSEICLADAQIEAINYGLGVATVLVKALGGAFEITFHTVLAVKAVSPIGEDLSHLAEKTESPFLTQACEEADEPASGFKEYSFVSAWSERPLLTVIAIDVTVLRTTS